jgi:hypothetical protein
MVSLISSSYSLFLASAFLPEGLLLFLFRPYLPLYSAIVCLSGQLKLFIIAFIVSALLSPGSAAAFPLFNSFFSPNQLLYITV